jgi:hypothetical protein
MIFEKIGFYYPNLTERELEVCRKVITTMWDFHWDVGDYDEVVMRELDNPMNHSQKELTQYILNQV